MRFGHKDMDKAKHLLMGPDTQQCVAGSLAAHHYKSPDEPRLHCWQLMEARILSLSLSQVLRRLKTGRCWSVGFWV